LEVWEGGMGRVEGGNEGKGKVVSRIIDAGISAWALII
jgi:hypothetical protein